MLVRALLDSLPPSVRGRWGMKVTITTDGWTYTEVTMCYGSVYLRDLVPV